eukprot:CAMPEP_0198112418 /NCGR_PEP_ID=MMETSP1442-20131203/4275_1 /TAXON_ID= /ORGANISM="Craspedostauros australis, Strain CCMP3328" /LENGTH=75 /DNA_ID=CAMNT_0043769181 /DNA_START=74 /DNA_END=301 /DNA_ORIENTATION=-
MTAALDVRKLDEEAHYETEAKHEVHGVLRETIETVLGRCKPEECNNPPMFFSPNWFPTSRCLESCQFVLPHVECE